MINTVKTTLLLATLTALLVFVGGAVGGRTGMIVMLAFSALMNLGTWWFSDQIVLRTSGAVPLDGQLQWLEDDVAALAREAGIPKPRVYVVPNELSPNAFATGRSPEHGVVAVTAGLLRTLDRRQIRGVLAHELGHIAHRDTLISAVAATMAGVISMLGRMAFWFGGMRDENGGGAGGIALALLAPLLAAGLHMAVSRSREYAADERAARLTGDPEGLAQALERLTLGAHAMPLQSGNQATHYIVNGFAGGLGKLFSTHPPIEERIARLRSMGR